MACAKKSAGRSSKKKMRGGGGTGMYSKSKNQEAARIKFKKKENRKC